ncbi:hypothetical protein, partial [Psychrobacter immobilis]|uniref:hypothetical protein n=1 Tax=Psychrobacter immobilis TaxID=498 RepID=UPI001D0FAD98
MSILSKLREIESKHNVKLHQGENFKQALYNDKMTDSEDCIIEPPRVYRRVIYLSQAAMPDMIKLS